MPGSTRVDDSGGELDRVAQLEAAVRARDELMAMTGHELRNPMSTLGLEVELLLRHAHAGGPATSLIPRLEALARHMVRFTKRAATLLDVSQLAAGPLELEREQLDLVALVREVMDDLKLEAEHAKAPLELEAPQEPVLGRWDRLRLEQVVWNLASNALKFGAGRPVRLVVERRQRSALLVVQDQGVGIAAEDQARIFDRFEQAVGRRVHGGFGVGLWIVRTIVDAHGGTIGIVSAAGRGATFAVELPLAPEGEGT